MSVRDAAHRRAFALLEAVQGEDHVRAVAQIEGAQASAVEWPEVLFVLAAARTVHAVVHQTEDRLVLVDDLFGRADDPASIAMALGLRALVAATEGDTVALLSHASRAVALLDDDTLPGRERCLAFVIVAAALNTLRLWELVDELYSRALEHGDDAQAAGQLEAVAVNRVLIRLERALALLEHGDDEGASEQVALVREAVALARTEQLRPLWQHNVEAVSDLLNLLEGEPLDTTVEEHRALLLADGDVEVLPLLDAAAMLVAWQEEGAAPDQGPVRISTSSGARSFPLWVRSVVLADGSPAARAAVAHAQLLSQLLWESRTAVLSSAQAQIAIERRRREHERLQLAVHTDPLTGLHNRRRFEDWLQRPTGAVATALALLDLDRFKEVNDTHGHAVGDEVLRRVGMLLRTTIRPGDLAMRQGGDEFAIVLQDDQLDSSVVLERLSEVAAAVAGQDWSSVAPGLRVHLSAGVAMTEGAVGSQAGPALYEAADRALYLAKERRRGPELVIVPTAAVQDR